MARVEEMEEKDEEEGDPSDKNDGKGGIKEGLRLKEVRGQIGGEGDTPIHADVNTCMHHGYTENTGNIIIQGGGYAQRRNVLPKIPWQFYTSQIYNFHGNYNAKYKLYYTHVCLHMASCTRATGCIQEIQTPGLSVVVLHRLVRGAGR